QRVALLFAFTEQIPVPEEILATDVAAALRRAGLIVDAPATAPGHVVATVSAIGVREAVILADSGPARPAFVMQPGPATLALADLVPREVTGRRVLDLGAGPGSVGVVAALRGADVVVTDLSERCAAFMAANATLNGVSLDVRVGDLYEPVSGDAFDLVLCQPPYLPAPDDLEPVLYLHGGSRGDALLSQVLAGLPDVLVPGGEGIVMFHTPGDVDDAAELVRSALGGRGCDIALFCSPGSPAEPVAIALATVHDPTYGAGWDEAVVRYARHLSGIGEAATSTLVYVRRRSDEGPAWSTLASSGGVPHSRRSIDAFVRSADTAVAGDDAILAAMVRPPPGTRLAMQAPLDESGERTIVAQFADDSYVADREISSSAAGLLQVLSTSESVSDAVVEVTARSPDDPTVVREEVIAFVRDYLLRGVLQVVATPS
ncbi:MAG: methyltransferase, partial [Acidimicrobiales bacterium]